MLNFIIVDDDVRHNIDMKKWLERVFEKIGIEASIPLSTTKPDDVIEYSSCCSNRNNVYLLDVDIQSNINGIEIAGIIREQDIKAYIIFVSAHPEYVMSSLKVRIFDYLIKPVSILTLGECVKAVYRDFKKIHSDTIHTLTVKSGFTAYTLNMDEIIYFEKFGHLLVIHTTTGKIESSESLDSIETRLGENCFFRCHKSFIVNTSCISKIDFTANMIHMKNGESCLMSKRSKKEMKELYAC